MADQPSETYNGSCHCKAFEFSIKVPKLEGVSACNCSLCVKNGYLWAMLPSKDDITVHKGDGSLKDYRFGNKTMPHSFCPECGVSIMARSEGDSPMTVVNARTLEDVDIDSMQIKSFDGASYGGKYEAPNGPKTTNSDDSTQIYGGSCHCGKVIFELKSKPLSEIEVTECNCSICSRNAYLWVYPSKEDVIIHGKENLSCYRFGTGVGGHSFCSTCGVAVFNQIHDPENKTGIGATQPVNLRTLNGVDLSQLKVKKMDGKSFNPEEKMK